MGCASSKQNQPLTDLNNVGNGNKAGDDNDQRGIIEGLQGAYKVSKVLGKGVAGSTWLGEDVNTGKALAIKLIKLPLPTKLVQAIFREIKLQSELGEGHNNIITPEEVVLTNHYLGLVMEYAPGGSLTQFVGRKYKACGGAGLLITEEFARYLFRQVMNAVEFCHDHQVAHRDLKLDNTLLSDHNPPLIKLCDFGFARGWGETSQFTTVIGTPDYMSPQIAGSKSLQTTTYDGAKADVWAMGVLLCVILTGRFPFDADSKSTMKIQDSMKKVWAMQNKSNGWRENKNLHSQLQYLSKDCLDLLDGMFQVEEKTRLSVKDIREHVWFKAPMNDELTKATEEMERIQAERDEMVAAGKFVSKERDTAISNLIKLSASPEFRKRAAEPITPDTTFQIWSRINLRTVEDNYPMFDQKSLADALLKEDSSIKK